MVRETSEYAKLDIPQPRLYQQTILSTCALKNTLVVLPTGLGKTMIALLLAANRLHNHPKSKILFFAPTRPLVEQHYHTFRKHLPMPDALYAVFTGAISSKKRKEQFEKATFIFSTPQSCENDLINTVIDLSTVSLIIFDEAHRATGNYAYTFIAQQYNKLASHPRILALTASPGSDQQTVAQVCENLFIEDIEVRTEEDPDVKPYMQEVKITTIEVQLPPQFKIVQEHLKQSYRSTLAEIKQMGFIKGTSDLSRTELLKLQAHLRAEMSLGSNTSEVFRAISLAAQAMKVQHAIELIETQGIPSLVSYLNDIYNQAQQGTSKAAKNLAMDSDLKSARYHAQELLEQGVEHPKLIKCIQVISSIISADRTAKIILFNNFRDSASHIVSKLKEHGILAELFVGQAHKREKGLSQKEQKAMLDRFRAAEFNVLVATSVAEEGLDIPKVEHVLFYEPVPSTIRTIQRRGRTGRNEEGSVTVFMTKGTRDEIYKWSAHHKERRMYSLLRDLKKNFRGAQMILQSPSASIAQNFSTAQRITILCDQREKGSRVIKQLCLQGARCASEQLSVGDFVLSPRVAIEYKTDKDFVDSILDGRLFSQLRALKKQYARPVLILEGDNLFNQRNVHPNAIRGAMTSIAIDFGIPVLRTKDEMESAAMILMMARREQEEAPSSSQLHSFKPKDSFRDAQLYIISSFPYIGPTLAPILLDHFGSVKNIVNATEDELKQVENIGEKKAKELRRFFG